MPVATAAPEEGLPDRRKSMTDPRFEFDAPRYYDFARGSPESGSRPDDWFSDARATAGLKSPPDSEKAEPDENAPPADAPHKSTAAQSLHGKLVAAQSSAPAPRPVLAPIENAVLSRAASTEDSCTGQGSSSPTKEAPRSPPEVQEPNPQTAVSAAEGTLATNSASEDLPAEPAQDTPAAEASPPPKAIEQPPRPPPGRVSGRPERAAPPPKTEATAKAEATATTKALPAPEPRPAEQTRGRRPAAAPRLHAMRTRSLSKETLESKATVVPSSPWRSRAERIAEFEGRLQTRPRRANATHAGAQDFQTAGPDRAPGLLTLPHSPALQTRKRTRPARFKSREEVEAEEMAAMPPFKARPFRKSMFSESAPRPGVPAVPPRPTTEQEPFHLVTDRRAATRTTRG